MTYKFHHRSFRSLTRAVLFIAALAATALGCVWLGTPDSVRFNDSLSYREMERLPPLPDFPNETDSTETSSTTEEVAAERKQLVEYSKRAGVALDEWLKPGDLTS